MDETWWGRPESEDEQRLVDEQQDCCLYTAITEWE